MGIRHSRVAHSLWLISILELRLDKLDSARSQLLRALAIVQEDKSNHAFLFSRIASALASIYVLDERYSDAELLYVDALDILSDSISSREITPRDRGTLAELRLGLGDLKAATGQKESAQDSWNEGVGLVKELVSKSDAFVYLESYTVLIARLGRHDEAERVARRLREQGPLSPLVAAAIEK